MPRSVGPRTRAMRTLTARPETIVTASATSPNAVPRTTLTCSSEWPPAGRLVLSPASGVRLEW